MTVLYKTSDPCTDRLLDAIGRYEAGGNYNAVIGDSHADDDLGILTLTAVYRLMDSLLVQGRPSTAVGRYQIIRTTLRTLAEKARLPATTLFTPELQDRLGFMLLCGCGYRNWWIGALSDRAFLHNISLEWASMPDPFNDGRSHYDGIGSNHAGVGLATMDAVLAALRADIDTMKRVA